MKRISWGTGIALTIIIFMLTSFGFIYFSFSQDVNLVEDNYYEKEMKYQEQIERINRANALPEKLAIKIADSMLDVTFPTIFSPERISGKVHLYRPSAEKSDVFYEIKLNNKNKLFIPTDNLSLGMWKVKVSWAAEGLDYYNEKIIMIR
ncbi:MAG: hypothetical protein GXO87_03875 [Chlorobi bacterium]|nr:hypothetical protein [Chlorobiota bacterium]